MSGYYWILCIIILLLLVVILLLLINIRKGLISNVNYEEIITETPWQSTKTGKIGYRYIL